MAENVPLFSVIIPTYNRAHIISDALNSVHAQTFRDFEIIVIDDGSSDNTLEVVAKYPETKYLKQPNAGPGPARARGIECARGKYLVFLDSDDAWFPWTLETFSKAIIENSTPSIIMGSFVSFHDIQELSRQKQSSFQSDKYKDYLDSWANGRLLGHIQGCNCAYLAEEYGKSGGCVHIRMNNEDVDLFLRMGTSPNFVKINAPVLYAYREHAVQLVKQSEQMLIGLEYLLEAERNGVYPGGASRQKERLNIICFTARSGSCHALNNRQFGHAWHIFTLTFKYHLQLKRFKFLLGFMIVFMARIVKATAIFSRFGI